MQKKSLYYDFKGLRFSPFTNQLEVLANGKKTKLSQIHCLFLLTLVENPRAVVTFDDLRQSIWLHEPTVDGRLIRNIQSTKNHLVNVFKSINVPADFIKPIPGKGYLLDADATEEIQEMNSENTQSVSTTETPVSNDESIEVGEAAAQNNRLLGEHTAYIAISSLLYGLLYWIALLLEVAYRFDRFGTTALWLGLPMVLWIAAMSFGGLVWTKNLVRQKNRKALFIGLAFFVGGTFLLCLAISYFLPNEPVTAARFQTQPAFSAFVKNSLIYFLPLGVVFILIPFHFVCVRENLIADVSESVSHSREKGAVNLRFSHLFGLWLIAVMYAIISTFYLLDNLLPGEFHGLFVALAFLRFFIYFGLSLACLFWYRTVLNFVNARLNL
jgi:DNA-binding winged helix-turn-helix (wHTH) protein